MSTLLYVDPSPRGQWALSLARLLAPARLTPLTLLATQEDVAGRPALLRDARAALGDAGVGAEEVVRPGPGEKAIVVLAQERRFDLVIVPPAGRKALARMLKGSRVATVVRRVPATVLIARRPPATLKRILAAVSGGAATQAVATAARSLASETSAEVTFLHVVPEVTLPYAHGDAGKEPPRDVAPESLDDVRRVLGENAPAVAVREGLVVDEVLEMVDQGAFDLLVVGAPAREGAGWAVEDLTERMVLGCATSMLVVRDR